MQHLKIEISGDIEKGKVSDLTFLVNGTPLQELDMFSHDGMFAPVLIALCMDRVPNAAQVMIGVIHGYLNQKGYGKVAKSVLKCALEISDQREIEAFFKKMRTEN